MTLEEIKNKFPESEEWNGVDGYNIQIRVGNTVIRQTGQPPEKVRNLAYEKAVKQLEQ